MTEYKSIRRKDLAPEWAATKKQNRTRVMEHSDTYARSMANGTSEERIELEGMRELTELALKRLATPELAPSAVIMIYMLEGKNLDEIKEIFSEYCRAATPEKVDQLFEMGVEKLQAVIDEIQNEMNFEEPIPFPGLIAS